MWKHKKMENKTMKKAIVLCICLILLSACAGVQQSDEAVIKQHLEQAEIYMNQMDFDLAEANFESAIKLSKGAYGEESKEVADLYLELAICNDTYDDAIYNVEIAESIFQKQIDNEGLAKTYFSYGTIYQKKFKYDLSQQAYENALKYCDLSAADISELKFNIYLSLSGLESMSGEESLKYAQDAEQLFDKISDDQRINLYISMGNTYYNLGEPKEAINSYEKSLNLWQNLKDKEQKDEVKKQIAETYDLCGHCYSSIGNPGKGIEYVNRSLEIFKTITDTTTWDFACAYRHLSVAYTREETMDIQKALEYGLKSCKIYLDKESTLSSKEIEELIILKDALRELYEVNLQITEEGFDTWYQENVTR